MNREEDADILRTLCLAFIALAPQFMPIGGLARPASATAAAPCRVTIPDPATVPPPPLDPTVRPSDRDWLWRGNQYLWTQIPPDGTYQGDDMGAAYVKVPWWRMVSGRLAIHGHPVGARRPHIKPDIPYGYGDSGFQATGIIIPHAGCWRITGTVAGHGISYVVKVVRDK